MLCTHLLVKGVLAKETLDQFNINTTHEYRTKAKRDQLGLIDVTSFWS